MHDPFFLPPGSFAQLNKTMKVVDPDFSRLGSSTFAAILLPLPGINVIPQIVQDLEKLYQRQGVGVGGYSPVSVSDLAGGWSGGTGAKVYSQVGTRGAEIRGRDGCYHPPLPFRTVHETFTSHGSWQNQSLSWIRLRLPSLAVFLS